MKMIIDGKRYDTETAEFVHGWSNGYYSNDFKHRSKDLYRTKSGNWFIVHEGGAMTDMAQACGSGSKCGGCEIEPVSTEDAFGFLCSHDGEKAAEKYFPDKIQDA